MTQALGQGIGVKLDSGHPKEDLNIYLSLYHKVVEYCLFPKPIKCEYSLSILKIFYSIYGLIIDR